MAELVIRGLGEEIVRNVRAQAALEGKSVKEWVTDLLVLGYTKSATKSGETIPVKVPRGMTVQVVEEVAEKRDLIPGARCYCGAGVYQWANPETRITKWKCVGSPSHFLSPKEIQS